MGHDSRRDLLHRLLTETSDFQGTYDEAKAFSRKWDEALGFQKIATETRLRSEAKPRALDDEQSWIGLPLDSLETPYPEIFAALKVLRVDRPDFDVLDLGAAYGRVGLLLQPLYPQARFTGIEIENDRVLEAQRVYQQLGVDRAQLVHGNLSVDAVPAADVYFVYDLGTVARIRSVLDQIQRVALDRPVTVIGRGRATRNLIESAHPWLAEVVNPVHLGNLSVYRSRA